MFTKFLPVLALATLCSVLTAAQTQQPPLKNAPEAAKLPATNPLALTDAEKSELAGLIGAVQSADSQLTARLKAILEISCGNNCDESYVVGLAVTDARKFYREQVLAANDRYGRRLAEMQKAHDCAGCAIKDGVFVKAAK